MNGNLTKLGTDKYRLRVYIGRVNDKPVMRSRTFYGGKRAAQAALRQLIDEVQSAGPQGSETPVQLLIDRWWEGASIRLSPNTLRAYRRYLDLYVLPQWGAVKIGKVLPEHLDAWYAKLRKRLAPASIHQIHSILNAAFSQAVKWRWLASSNVRLATPPPVVHKRKKPMTVEDLQKLLANADEPLRAAIVLGALTGARRAELCALKWSDYAEGSIHIERSLVYKDQEWAEAPTKTHADRYVAVGLSEVFTADILKNAPYILGGAKPWSPDGLSNAFWKLTRQLGMSHSFHDLRKFSVTQLIAAGVDPRTVATRHGHSNVNTTLNIYAQSVRERDQAAAAVIGNIVNQEVR